MRRELTLTTNRIDEAGLLACRSASTKMGAIIYFAGVVRATEGDKPIEGLNYEAFETMARHQFNLIFDEAERRWPLESVRLAHRIGNVAAGEVSLWVEVTAPHRQEAFEACQFLVDKMKVLVPIWKRPLTIGEGSS